MRIIVAGSSGMLGSALVPYLAQAGYTVQRLVREQSGQNDRAPDLLYWQPDQNRLDSSLLEGADVIINLSGDNIFNGRWTESKKEKIRRSRVDSTLLLSKTIAGLKKQPQLLINASAVGIYGSRGDNFLSEDSPPGEGFLADVVRQWEQATAPAQKAGVRVVCLRLGIVLSRTGGALKKMLPPFKWGLGGILGSGNQYMSWIAIDDVLRIITFLIHHKEIRGAVNATSPHPVSNEEFTKILGSVLHRPTFCTLSEFILSIAFGEMSKDVLLGSIRAEPVALTREGFKFRYPVLRDAFEHLLITL